MRFDTLRKSSRVHKWIRIFSPFACIEIFFTVVILWAFWGSKRTDGWSLLAIPTLLSIAIALLIIDLILKDILPKNILTIWLMETMLILIGMICYWLW
ncbi:MAG: hypothetical protein PSX81_04120 [bacterium]|nr:hypothetical protein [bacterium]